MYDKILTLFLCVVSHQDLKVLMWMWTLVQMLVWTWMFDKCNAWMWISEQCLMVINVDQQLVGFSLIWVCEDYS